jgi:hypothetical protein
MMFATAGESISYHARGRNPPHEREPVRACSKRRRTGTGHLTKDPKSLETDGGTAICTRRIAVTRAAGKARQGKDATST